MVLGFKYRAGEESSKEFESCRAIIDIPILLTRIKDATASMLDAFGNALTRNQVTCSLKIVVTDLPIFEHCIDVIPEPGPSIFTTLPLLRLRLPSHMDATSTMVLRLNTMVETLI